MWSSRRVQDASWFRLGDDSLGCVRDEATNDSPVRTRRFAGFPTDERKANPVLRSLKSPTHDEAWLSRSNGARLASFSKNRETFNGKYQQTRLLSSSRSWNEYRWYSACHTCLINYERYETSVTTTVRSLNDVNINNNNINNDNIDNNSMDIVYQLKGISMRARADIKTEAERNNAFRWRVNFARLLRFTIIVVPGRATNIGADSPGRGAHLIRDCHKTNLRRIRRTALYLRVYVACARGSH